MASALDFGSSVPQKTLVKSRLRKRSLSLVACLGLSGQSSTFDLIFWDPIPRYLPRTIFFGSSLAEFGIGLVIVIWFLRWMWKNVYGVAICYVESIDAEQVVPL
jgi:hypothetical protein